MNKDFNCFFLSGALFLGNIFFACSKEETAKYIPPVTVPVKSNPSWKADARCFLDGETGTFDDMAVKDPSIVYYNGNYHLFYTGRDVGTGGNWRMGYASAVSLEGLNAAKRTYMSSLNGGSYFCAPQVFWFAAKNKWYLVYQSGLGATYSTNSDVGDVSGWKAGQTMGFSDGIDFWCIADEANVYCFYSAQDGSHTIKRRSTTIANFPFGWSAPSVIATNTFEAPHVYKNKANGNYYLVVEDIGRHQELWKATSLNGTWSQIAEKWAANTNLTATAEHWTDQVSHVEILRSDVNEKMEVTDFNHCDMLIQGVVDGTYADYGSIPYDLGIIRNY
jgi:hypothetical protein